MQTRSFIAFLLTLLMTQTLSALPNPFNLPQSGCKEYSKEKYEADMKYIQDELFNNSRLMNTTQEIHRIELQACQKSSNWENT